MGPGPDVPGGILSVIQSYLKSEYLKEYNQLYIITAANSNKVLRFLQGILKYIWLELHGEVELAHLHMSERGSCYRAIVIVFISMLFRTPVIVHSHGSEIVAWYNSLNFVCKRVFGYAMQKCQFIIVLTPGWKDFWCRIVEESKIIIIPNFIEAKAYTDKVYLSNNMLNIIFLGYVGERKGIYDLIKAAKILKDNKLNFCIRIGGNGEIEKCKEFITQLKLEDKVFIYGWLDKEKKETILRQSDILILPSYYESFGIVILEAMMYQLPIICGSSGHSKEIISVGIDGYIAKTGDVCDLVKQIMKLSDLTTLKKMGDAAYQKAMSGYTEQSVMPEIKKLYDKSIRCNYKSR